MEVLNQTPFRFGFLAGRVLFPGHSLTLLVKGTFDLNPGGPATLSQEQHYPTGDEYEPEDEERQGSPRYSSDFVFLKEKADLLLVGRCFPPGGRPAPRCTVAFRVGNLRHTLQVTGDRYWAVRGDRWVPTKPEPFAEMPLRYERAFGGEGFGPNPAGKGFVDVAAVNGRMVRPLPNIEVPDALVLSPQDRPPPAGFGPLHPGWESRRGKLGAYGGDYLRKRWPWFAEDMDRGQFNAAPPSMQLQGYLRGDEGLLFENLHPNESVYHSALPGLRVRCFVNRKEPKGGWDFGEVDLRLDTLWVDMESERLVLVWRGWTQVASSEHEEVRHVYIVSEPMSEAPGSMDHYREAFGSTLARQAAGHPPGDTSAAAGTVGADGSEEAPATDDAERAAPDGSGAEAEPGAPTEPDEHGAEAGAGDGSTVAPAAGAAEGLDPELQRVFNEARPHLARLGIDPADLERGDPEEVVSELLEKLKAELWAHGVDSDNPPEFTLEQKQFQARIMADLGIPWNAATGLPELEGFEPEDPESMIEEQLAKLKSHLRARGIDPDQPQEPTPEQKAHLARLGIDFDALKGALAGPTSEAGESGEESGQEELPSPESVRAQIERGESLAGGNLAGLDLAGFILPGASLAGALLAGASLAATDLEGVDLRGANLASADLRGAKLVGARLDEADLTGADLTGADLREATLDGASGEGAVFQEAKLDGCSATRALLRGANLKKARGSGARFDGADLTGSDLEGANLFKASLRDTRLGGAHAPKANLAQSDVTGLRASGGANLAGASFFRAEGSKPMWMESDLSGADFRWARLEAADFTGANLTGARLHAADLPRARFRKANLTGATMTRVNLFEGSFERADLTGVDLRSSNLFAVEFLNATLDSADTENANLKRTKLVLEGWEP